MAVCCYSADVILTILLICGLSASQSSFTGGEPAKGFLPSDPDNGLNLTSDFPHAVFKKLSKSDGDDGKTVERDPGSPADGGNNAYSQSVQDHRYYRSRTITKGSVVKRYWVDFNKADKKNVGAMLNVTHQTVPLPIKFPFYGRRLRNVTIMSEGYLFTGEEELRRRAFSMSSYIAPLMAGFDVAVGKDATIRYTDDGGSFIVQWSNVALKDQPDVGTFTFQVTLRKNGDIMFLYKAIPIVITSINENRRQVRVGLSDTYLIDRTIFFIRRRTYYEYHRVDMKDAGIGNWTGIYLKARPTCVSLTTCHDCLTKKISFQCGWCPNMNACSDGHDRNQFEWRKGCPTDDISDPSKCPHKSTRLYQ